MSDYPTYLIHYGVPGQKWGNRRYQFEDGTYTEEGKRRRRIGDDRDGSNETLVTGSKGPSGNNSKTKFTRSIKDDVKSINGGKRGFEYGFNRHENCAFCSMSYELTRRGHDVRAQESLRGVEVVLNSKNGAFGKIIPNFSKLSKDTKNFAMREKSSSTLMGIGMSKKEYSEMVNSLTEEGEGARGFITVKWHGYGGHIFNYEVNNGKLYFIDAQVGEVKKADKTYYNNTLRYANNISTLRIDNVKMNEEKAKKYYSEDKNEKIRINTLAEKGGLITAFASLAGYPLGPLGMWGAGSVADGIIEKKIKERYDEAALELQNKWVKEGRFKEKWYDMKVDTKSDTNGKIDKNDQSRIKSLISSGKTQEEVAKILGVSVSTVKKYK